MLKKFDHWLGIAEKGVLVALFLLMVLLSFAQVILREFFSTGFLWADVFLRHCVLWVGFLGAGIATQQNKHFAIDFVKRLLPAKFSAAAEIMIDFFAVVCLYFLSDAAIKFIQDDYTHGSVLFSLGTVQVKSFWMNAIIPIGFILLTVHFFLKLLSGFLPAQE